MTAQRDPESVLAAWLDEGPTDLPDATRRAILTALSTTPQARRGPLAPWRLPVNITLRAVAAIAVAILAIGGGIYLLGPRLGGAGTGSSRIPTVAPTLSAAPSTPALPTHAPRPAAADFDKTFTSALYGFSVNYPSGWTVMPGTAAIAPNRIPQGETLEADRIWLDEMELIVTAEPVSVDMTESAWATKVDGQLLAHFGFASGCPTATTSVIVDGESATEVSYADCQVATFMWVTTVHAGSGYQIAWTDYAYTPMADAQQTFDGFLRSFRFTR